MKNEQLNNKVNQVKDIPYINKVLFFNKISIIINLVLFISKAILAGVYLDLLFGLSSLYSFFIVLCKVTFYAGELDENNQKSKYKYYLMMTIYLFIGSFIMHYYSCLLF